MIIDTFNDYKNLTLKIINDIESDKDVEELMKERQILIDKIGSYNDSKEEKKRIYIEINADEADRELEKAITDKMKDTKKQINDEKKRKQAFSSYTSNQRRENLFAKKV